MILASCRKGFIGTDAVAPLQLHDGDRSIAVEDLANRLSGKRVLILIHGFDNQFSGALDSYQIVAQRVAAAQIVYDEVIGFFWPGSWCFAGFFEAEVLAATSAVQLAALITALTEVTPTTARTSGPAIVDIETHSLGAKVALEALAHGSVTVRNVILTAPAVNDNCFLPAESFEHALSAVWQIAVLFSNNDPVLKFAYTPAQLHLALGLVGPEPLPRPTLPSVVKGYILPFDLSAVINNHGAYKSCLDTYRAWRSLAA